MHIHHTKEATNWASEFSSWCNICLRNINFKRGRFILAEFQKFQSVMSWPYFLGPTSPHKA